MATNNTFFTGLGTALITPFKNGGAIDYTCVEKLVEIQIEEGVDYLLVAGTTGEAATMSEKETKELFRFIRDQVKGRVPVMLGCSDNDTNALVERIQGYNCLSPDGYLVTAPYYNKPTQEGLFRHFMAVSKVAEEIPIVLYNIPGRTACTINIKTIVRLVDNTSNIIGVKDAVNDVVQSMELMSALKEITDKPFTFISGDDALALPLIAIGYDALISVISNELPGMTKELIHSALSGDLEKARQIQHKMLPLMKANFTETSPGPVKYVMKKLGLCDGSVRLPLSEFNATPEFDEVLKKLEFI